MFKPLVDAQGREQELPIAGSESINKGDHVKFNASGYIIQGTTGDDNAEFIAKETKDNSNGSDGDKSLLVIPTGVDILFQAVTDKTPSRGTHVGNSYDFEDASTIDTDNTTDKVFRIIDIVNSNDKTVLGYFR